MIFVALRNDFLKYEIEDTLKLFLKEEEIFYADSEPRQAHRGIFLSGEYLNKEGVHEFHLHFESEILKQDITIVPEPKAHQNGSGDPRKLLKWPVKQKVYDLLSKVTGKKLPWGILTGIRPSKIVHELMEQGLNREKILHELTGYYRVSGAKADLLYNIAAFERKVLDRTSPNMVSLYIGIPFCPSRCLYCSFTSNPLGKNSRLVEAYLDALVSEIKQTGQMIRECGFQVQSIYIGGGTPTSLDCAGIEKLLGAIASEFDLSTLEEYTLEAGRPDSIDEAKLKVIASSWVTRISINPQTMNDVTLKAIGRNHTAADIEQCFKLARRMGFNNINADLIIGLPGEDLRMFEYTLEKIVNLHPESITVHTLAVKRASRLNEEKEKHPAVTAAEAEAMIEKAAEYAGKLGMQAYYMYRQKNMVGNLENIGYCKPGFESTYNIQIMEERQTIVALGAGAVTKVYYPDENRIERAFNVKNVEEYIRRIDEMMDRKRVLLDAFAL